MKMAILNSNYKFSNKSLFAHSYLFFSADMDVQEKGRGKMLILQYVSRSVEKCRLKQNATDENTFYAHSIYKVCKDAPWESKMR
jgi:hypothetical protein